MVAGRPLTAQPASKLTLRSEMLVTTEWLAEHLNDHDVVVLCVNSTPEFYSKGHIPGARQIKLGDIAVTRDGIPNELPPVEDLRKVFAAAGVGNSSRVVLYGERSNLFAARAYFTLDYLGVAGRAALLDGGLEAEKDRIGQQIVDVDGKLNDLQTMYDRLSRISSSETRVPVQTDYTQQLHELALSIAELRRIATTVVRLDADPRG